jgi:hypothetical protein
MHKSRKLKAKVYLLLACGFQLMAYSFQLSAYSFQLFMALF